MLFSFAGLTRKKQFGLLFLYRFINSLIVRTYWDPDEYWQGGEVAWWFWHDDIIGGGSDGSDSMAKSSNHLLSGRTWEWTEKIRSSFFPFILLALQPLSTILPSPVFLMLPKLLMSLNQATIDFLLYDRIASKNQKSLALIFQITNPFNFLYGTRSLANNVESLLFTLVHAFPKSTMKELLISLSIWIRPSMLLLWIYPIISSLPSSLLSFMWSGPLAILIGILVDGVFYSTFPLLTWWNFFKHNILHGKSHHYGTSPFSFHFTQSLPLIAGPFLICLPLVEWDYTTRTVAAAIFSLSLIGHKEHRFTIPLIPLLMLSSSKGYRRWMKNVLLAVGIVSIIPLLYFSSIHGRAPLAVMDYLRGRKWNVGDKVFFAMPCHSTPLYSYLNLENPPVLHWLSCPPPGIGFDEADDFYQSPLVNLKTRLLSDNYRMFIAYENGFCGHSDGFGCSSSGCKFINEINNSLKNDKYSECWRGYNGLFGIDSRRKGDLVVWCK